MLLCDARGAVADAARGVERGHMRTSGADCGQTGRISVAVDGHIEAVASPEDLRRRLSDLLGVVAPRPMSDRVATLFRVRARTASPPSESTRV